MRTRFAADMLLIAGVAAMLSGCVVLPLKRFQPVIAPPSDSCTPDRSSLLASEPTAQFHYVLPPSVPGERILLAGKASGPLFETYRTSIQTAVRGHLPGALQTHRVTNAFLDLLLSVSGEAQVDAQIANHVLTDSGQIAAEREAIRKHRPPDKLTHGEMKDFADKLFDLQLKPGAAPLTGSSVNESGLSASEVQYLHSRAPLDKAFIAYFEAYYKGKFIDRMGASVDPPQISTTIPDSEIVAAETVLLEFLIDTIDGTPVMGDDPPGSISSSTTFYPGKSMNEPTAYATGFANYIQIPKDPNACGVTTTNAWVLRDLANAAADHAAAVGGLVANTPGGISLGLGVVGKISIGDNQTLSAMVKAAASRVALRATLASSYFTLRNFRFNVPEPGN
jgi:hypothetical protein